MRIAGQLNTSVLATSKFQSLWGKVELTRQLKNVKLLYYYQAEGIDTAALWANKACNLGGALLSLLRCALPLPRLLRDQLLPRR